jgi:hypothetical protein
MLDTRCWINPKKPFHFIPVSLQGVGSTLRPVSPTASGSESLQLGEAEGGAGNRGGLDINFKILAYKNT